MSMRGFDDFGGTYLTKPPSLAAGPRMMLPAQSQQMFENPTYTMSGKSGQQRVSYGVVPKGFLTFLGFLGNAEFSPWKRLSEFIELRKS